MPLGNSVETSVVRRGYYLTQEELLETLRRGISGMLLISFPWEAEEGRYDL